MPPSSSEAIDVLEPPAPGTSRRLFRLGLLALAGALFWLIRQSPLSDPVLLAIGCLIVIFGALPALNWARRAEAGFPIFEVLMLIGIPFYGVPLLAGHPAMLEFSESATHGAAIAILLHQFCAIAAYSLTRGSTAKSPSLRLSLLPEAFLRHASLGLWINSTYLYVNAFTEIIPEDLHIPCRAMFFGLGTISIFVELRRWGSGFLHGGRKFAIVLNLTLQVAFLFRELYLISGISLLLLALIAYVSTSRRIPIIPLLVILPVLAILHNGKPAMRADYWERQMPLPPLLELPAYFNQWFSIGLEHKAEQGETGSLSLAGRLFERASLFHMLCLVVERTPDTDPFLAGESYLHIPAQLIPRLFWPDKPSSMRSNVLLSLHYRLVPEESPTSVSIAFGMVAEAYANFGLTGCAVLGLLLGFIYKRIAAAALGASQFSALGLLTILLGAWSFQAEQILATWLVSLIQAGLVVIGLPLALRTLLPRE